MLTKFVGTPSQNSMIGLMVLDEDSNVPCCRQVLTVGMHRTKRCLHE